MNFYFYVSVYVPIELSGLLTAAGDFPCSAIVRRRVVPKGTNEIEEFLCWLSPAVYVNFDLVSEVGFSKNRAWGLSECCADVFISLLEEIEKFIDFQIIHSSGGFSIFHKVNEGVLEGSSKFCFSDVFIRELSRVWMDLDIDVLG